MPSRIRKDDIVEVISGDHKGAQGKVLRVYPDKERVLVEGVNLVYKHVRKSRQHPQGGRIRREAPLHVSKLLPVDPRTGRGTRVRFKIERDTAGKIVSKQRVSLSGNVLSDVTRAKSKRSSGGKK